MSPIRSGYTPVEFPRFGGLDLNVDPQQADGAVDALNVDMDIAGKLKSRVGFSSWFTSSIAPTVMVQPQRFNVAVLANATNVYVYGLANGLALASAASTDLPRDIVSSPDPAAANTAYYARSATMGFSVKKIVLTSATITAPAGIPTGTCVAVQTPDGRLVVGNSNSVDGRVAFSDPFTPETFGANNYVDMPSTVCALVSFNDMLLAFCATGLYVFYGNSTDSAGEPIFNYRLVSSSHGVGNSPRAAVAARDGVYFTTRAGVYRTTGGQPTKISDPIQPLFDGVTPPYFTGTGAGYLDEVYASPTHLFLRQDPSQGAWLVYRFSTGKWSYWTISNGALLLPDVQVTSGSANVTRLIVGSSSSTTIRISDPSATSDNGTAIVSRYRSGFWNPGSPGTETRVREWLIDGTGTVDFKTAVNDAATLGSAASLTMGTSPAIAQARDRRAIRGRNVSWQIGASSGAWSASRVVANVAGQNFSGSKSA